MSRSKRTSQVTISATILLILWTLILTGSMIWQLIVHKRVTIEHTRTEARTSIQKDIIYRFWNSEHGGVYAPSTPDTPPNPHLDHIAERDIETPSGKKLTLINPAYMTRQAHEIGKERFQVKAHITSLNPIRPENEADDWEKIALQTFENGEKEYSSVEKLDNEDYLRTMIPLVTTEACLKCHARQGYKVGDIRGGISVAIPLEPVFSVTRSYRLTIILAHVAIWILGVTGLLVGASKLNQRLRDLDQAEKDKLKQRTANLLAATIAHEFNTPLAVIRGHAELISESKYDSHDAAKCAEVTMRQVDKLRDLVQKLLRLKNLKEIDYTKGMTILDLHIPEHVREQNSAEEKDKEVTPED